MNVWAVVPVKPLNRAKSRLSDELSPERREGLAARLLEHTVSTLVPLRQIKGVLVISRDTKALSLVRDLGAQTVQESGTPELNNALYRATQVLRARGADAVLVVPADLPLLTEDDVCEMVHLGRYSNSVVIAPDYLGQGTNLLLVRPPGIIPYSFGENSFENHKRLAHEANATVMIYHSDRVALDIDTPEDLYRYIELANQLGEPIIEHTDFPAWVLVDESGQGN